MKKPILVVMAAGMGSRYGGLKQIDPVGCEGEAILDYSLFDAHEAGFDTAVIIIKEAIKKDFMETVGARLQKAPMEIRYAYQELEKLPTSYTVPEGRTKPWGTCHAVVCAREAIGDAPFAVINADDYYGKAAFKEIYNYLVNKAHAMGIRVLLDVVHSHAVKNTAEGINMFDGTTWQFFHDGPKGDHPAWGTKCFDYGKTGVLRFLLSNLKFWMTAGPSPVSVVLPLMFGNLLLLLTAN